MELLILELPWTASCIGGAGAGVGFGKGGSGLIFCLAGVGTTVISCRWPFIRKNSTPKAMSAQAVMNDLLIFSCGFVCRPDLCLSATGWEHS